MGVGKDEMVDVLYGDESPKRVFDILCYTMMGEVNKDSALDVDSDVISGSVLVHENGFFEGIINGNDEEKHMAFGIYHENEVSELVILPNKKDDNVGSLAFYGSKDKFGYKGNFNLITTNEEYILGNSMVIFNESLEDENDLTQKVDDWKNMTPDGIELYLDALAMQDILSEVVKDSKDRYFVTYLGLMEEVKEIVAKRIAKEKNNSKK